MTVNTRSSRYGTAGGTAINVDHGPAFDNSAPRKVQLTANYVLGTLEPGVPTRPAHTGAEVSRVKVAGQTIPSGTQLTLLAAEAAALVAANRATYV